MLSLHTLLWTYAHTHTHILMQCLLWVYGYVESFETFNLKKKLRYFLSLTTVHFSGFRFVSVYPLCLNLSCWFRWIFSIHKHSLSVCITKANEYALALVHTQTIRSVVTHSMNPCDEPDESLFYWIVCIISLSVEPTKSKQFPFTTAHTQLSTEIIALYTHTHARTTDTAQ